MHTDIGVLNTSRYTDIPAGTLEKLNKQDGKVIFLPFLV